MHGDPRAPAAVASEAGFTLIELILVIVLIGAIGIVGLSMISDTATTTQYVNDSETSSAKVRYVLERLEREIREVKRGGSAFAITTPLSTSSLVFVKENSDGTGDNTVSIDKPGTGSTLTIAYSNPAIAATKLSDRVTGFTITYWAYDPADVDPSDGIAVVAAQANDVNNLRFIQISLSLDEDGDMAQGPSVTQVSRFALRNSP